MAVWRGIVGSEVRRTAPVRSGNVQTPVPYAVFRLVEHLRHVLCRLLPAF